MRAHLYAFHQQAEQPAREDGSSNRAPVLGCALGSPRRANHWLRNRGRQPFRRPRRRSIAQGKLAMFKKRPESPEAKGSVRLAGSENTSKLTASKVSVRDTSG